MNLILLYYCVIIYHVEVPIYGIFHRHAYLQPAKNNYGLYFNRISLYKNNSCHFGVNKKTITTVIEQRFSLCTRYCLARLSTFGLDPARK